MSTAYAGGATYPATVLVPDDGDPPSAASVGSALEGLADRTAWLVGKQAFRATSFGDADAVTVYQAVATADGWVPINDTVDPLQVGGLGPLLTGDVLHFVGHVQVDTTPGDRAHVRVVLLFRQRVVNGTFAADTDWAKGAGWSIAAGVASGAATADVLSQILILENLKTYRVRYTVSNYVAGDIDVACGGVHGATVSANGTYTEDITSGGTNLTFTGDPAVLGNNFTGDIDDVEVQEVVQVPGSGSLAFDAACLSLGGRYELTTDEAECAAIAEACNKSAGVGNTNIYDTGGHLAVSVTR
jgi:hypothetical protein